jgi:hypothetical protein
MTMNQDILTSQNWQFQQKFAGQRKVKNAYSLEKLGIEGFLQGTSNKSMLREGFWTPSFLSFVCEVRMSCTLI